MGEAAAIRAKRDILISVFLWICIFMPVFCEKQNTILSEAANCRMMKMY